MNSKSAQIVEGLAALTKREMQILSGNVVAGSIDEDSGTVSVKITCSDDVMTEVAIASNTILDEGLVAIPDEDSNVVIATVDGPGQWAIVKTSKLKKVVASVANCSIVNDGTKIIISRNSSTLSVADKLTISNASENLASILTDLIDQIKLITVTTSGVASTVPANAAAIGAISTRVMALFNS